ncbi:hypothetical protein ACJRO7_008715 [Eucalyptus globulus]|uniref:protein-serine/threonine phosphatase n=1 Tax=Eucalyptus globulus TaxID=34317 RepID=A0ABD3ITA4_EUCGL
MGNGITSLRRCFADAGAGEISRRHDMTSFPHPSSYSDEGHGHSFCYIRQDPASSSDLHSEDCTTQTTVTSTTFSSISGASISANASSPLSTSLAEACYYTTTSLEKASVFESSVSFTSVPLQPVPRVGSRSGPMEKGFLSGPIELRSVSGPIDQGLYHSGSIVDRPSCDRWPRDFSLGGYGSKKRRLVKYLRRAIARRVLRANDYMFSGKSSDFYNVKSTTSSGILNGESEFYEENQNLEWAQGKAGEDRMHVVVSEENGLVFVGIYDGFNGPDAPDFLLSNLYSAVCKELQGLLSKSPAAPADGRDRGNLRLGSDSVTTADHSDVLNALETALKKTEEAFLETADRMVKENPELALMGSCVLAMLMRGEDIYLMNVGDSRAILAQKGRPDPKATARRIDSSDGGDQFDEMHSLISLQLTQDHSTYVEEEVHRIRNEHPDDPSAVVNDRVKGYLKVTRAFGAGFLKQPKWNDALLEMFRIDYIGTSPYITCTPSLSHHRLGLRDRFLILSSDGLNQYFTNQEAISEVDLFLSSFPEGDPAQHLVEEVLFRAAKQAGMDFHELLDIPQGDRRRYHDDVSIIIISLEGRIWRSTM